MITVEIKSRDFSTSLTPPKNLTFQVSRYSNKAIGGPFDAEINVIGPDLSLWELLEYMRCPVYLRDEKGERVWWGYIAEIEISARNPYGETNAITRVMTSIDYMFNRVAVAWEDIVVGTYAGPRRTTAYTDDDLSQSEYGIKEGLFSGTSASDQTLAEQSRDKLLDQKKYPIPSIEINASSEAGAILRCRGWWDTLNWLQCSVPGELALSYATVNGNFADGITGYERVAQGILPSGGDVNISSIDVYVRKVGAPTDNIQIFIYDNPDDLNPTTLLATGSEIDNADITTSYQWLSSTFSPEYVLTSGTKYFLVIGRAGAIDDANYFEVGIDTAGGYASGTFVYWDGANMQSTAYDAAFRIYDNALVLTSTQALSIITTYGQFFPIVECEVNSGVTSESFRDGDGTAHFEVEELLQHGTVRLRRMLTSVDENRRCVIYEEDQDIAANYYRVLSDGKMFDNYGAAVRPELAKCGVYARLVDAIPPSVDTTFLGNTIVRFIEQTEYDCKTGKLTYTARDQLDPLTVGRPLDG